jgi:hypothetical protein
MSENPTSWWEVVRGSGLRQGDWIPDCPVPALEARIAENATEHVADVYVYDCVVVTQSCDLMDTRGKSDFVAMCPVFTLAESSIDIGSNAGRDTFEKLRKGQFPAEHLLAGPVDHRDHKACLIVEFGNVFTVPTPFLEKFADGLGDRRRLRSPFVEHFSQAFARFFMRVGLPSDIPPLRKEVTVAKP